MPEIEAGVSSDECEARGGSKEEFVMQGDLCTFFPDTFMFSLILFFCTFVLVFALAKFRTSIYFPARVRMLAAFDRSFSYLSRLCTTEDKSRKLTGKY